MLTAEKVFTGLNSGRTFVRGDCLDISASPSSYLPRVGRIFVAHEGNRQYAAKFPLQIGDKKYHDDLTIEAERQASFTNKHITPVVLYDVTQDLLSGKDV